jgi:hypothetical protein
MTYNWVGPQPGYKDASTRTKGSMRKLREQKRVEAELRDAAYRESLMVSNDGCEELQNEELVKMPHSEAP